ncbi:MAG: Crp/Fnr family transcriptional regulator [Oscillospiraceae bacterium]|nr:Crp/Fnr family transcriptional regulator [Oscillospiraceae bacterium]
MEKYLPILRSCPFFSGMEDGEILSVLKCVGGRVLPVARGAYVLRAGDSTEEMGLVLSGSVLIIQEDLWGRRNIMSRCSAGDFFAEPYAATPGTTLSISAVADGEGEILLLNVRRLLTTCPSACDHHGKLIRNMVGVLARKMLAFNDKITHMSKRTTREKLLSYLSGEALKNGGSSFDIPYDRQQLADYLCVDRAAMSAELSKLRREGVIRSEKQHFEILTPMA